MATTWKFDVDADGMITCQLLDDLSNSLTFSLDPDEALAVGGRLIALAHVITEDVSL